MRSETVDISAEAPSSSTERSRQSSIRIPAAETAIKPTYPDVSAAFRLAVAVSRRAIARQKRPPRLAEVPDSQITIQLIVNFLKDIKTRNLYALDLVQAIYTVVGMNHKRAHIGKCVSLVNKQIPSQCSLH
jgi:hypothetical protein